jgi:polyisoprenoid-binding protein YceI
MKKIAFLTLIFALLQITLLAQQTYQLEIKKSKIIWNALKTMGNRHYGDLYFTSGSLNYNQTGAPTSGLFNLNMNSITNKDYPTATENKRIETQLKSEEFFNVAQYPNAIMKVNKIIRKGNTNTYQVSGQLTIKGITHPIEFPATIIKSGEQLKVTAQTKIDRIKWNIKFKKSSNPFNFMPDLKDKIIVDEIPLNLQLLFVK